MLSDVFFYIFFYNFFRIEKNQKNDIKANKSQIIEDAKSIDRAKSNFHKYKNIYEEADSVEETIQSLGEVSLCF